MLYYYYHFLMKKAISFTHTVIVNSLIICETDAKSTQPKISSLLLKNLQFLPNLYETRSKLPTHELVILAKFH